ncbi:hypothetical protein ACN28C_24960 [Plantactinospora sp. WMMC1484]|uniref:hypothetical protein n=1 Tax=Plantactinospora sp. WMMC1484 TaxID=3404122 RepID=UPI003BF597EF
MVRRGLMTVVALGGLLVAGLAAGGPAVAAVPAAGVERAVPAAGVERAVPAAGAERAVTADEWVGPIDQWTTFPFEDGWEICNRTGQIGVAFGAYKAYECRDNGWWTTYLYVQYYP